MQAIATSAGEPATLSQESLKNATALPERSSHRSFGQRRAAQHINTETVMRIEYTSLKSWRAAAKARGYKVRASCGGYKAVSGGRGTVKGRYFIGGSLR